jgi:hypothetical protein
MKSYAQLIDIIKKQRIEIVSLIEQAHQESLASQEPGDSCSIVGIGRDNGQLVHDMLSGNEEREDLYILAAYPHINPIEAVVLYADEKHQIISRWCRDHGTQTPEQNEDEGDVAYLKRLVDWVREHTRTTAGDILIQLIREQLLCDFNPEREFSDALDELNDLAQGIRHLPPSDDPEDSGTTGEEGSPM